MQWGDNVADIQKSGYTRIDNKLLEALCLLNISCSELRIMLYIIRMTNGFNRSFAELPLAEIAGAVGMKKANVSRALKKLKELDLIELHPNRGIRPQTISVNSCEKWSVESCAESQLSKQITVINSDNPTVINSDNPTVINSDNPTVINSDNHTYKERNKESIKERGKKTPSHEDKKNYSHSGRVLLTESEYEQLVKDYGESIIRKYIGRIDDWQRSAGKEYHDHAAAIRHWLEQDGVKKDDSDLDYNVIINRF